MLNRVLENKMQGDKAVIGQLNKVLTFKLTSINQYFLHARMYKNWGLGALDSKSYKKSIKDMKQADELIERVLFLEGLPNLQHLERLRIGENTEEMLSCDMQLQYDLMAQLREAIALSEEKRDYVSRDVLEEILEYEEEHVDWIETQQYLIEQSGIQNYLQSQMGE
jgi:bacterioferritin